MRCFMEEEDTRRHFSPLFELRIKLQYLKRVGINASKMQRLEFIFRVTCSLPSPSSLLKLPMFVCKCTDSTEYSKYQDMPVMKKSSFTDNNYLVFGPRLHAILVEWPVHFLEWCFSFVFVYFKVLSVEPDRRRLLLTHKKTMVESDLPFITDYSDAKPGVSTHGFITAIKDFGCLVTFYNNVKGLVPRTELG